MSIILDEYEWAEQALAARKLGQKPVETLKRIAKYYWENKYSKPDIRRLLETFILQCEPQSSMVHWSDTLDRVVKSVDKYPLIRVDGVDVTDTELAKIEILEGQQIRRLAFTLLCVAKYWDQVSDRNHQWVNSTDREIMKMANINTSIRRQSEMFSILRDCEMIRFSKKVDNLNVRVVFMSGGDTAIHIHDFRNLGYQYMKLYGGQFFECVNCGLTVKMRDSSRGRPQKYCPSCAVELHTKQKVDSVMRHRIAAKS